MMDAGGTGRRSYSARTPRGRTGTSSLRISILNSLTSSPAAGAGAPSLGITVSLVSVFWSLLVSIAASLVENDDNQSANAPGDNFFPDSRFRAPALPTRLTVAWPAGLW